MKVFKVVFVVVLVHAVVFAFVALKSPRIPTENDGVVKSVGVYE